MKKINKLITYANENNILDVRDNQYVYNALCYLLNKENNSKIETMTVTETIDELLEMLADDYKTFTTNTEKELFKAKIIDVIIDKPSGVQNKFYALYSDSPQKATNFFYDFSQKTNYIKVNQIKKNISYKVSSEFGVMDITINLSKPEKSPEEIAMLKNAKTNSWPKCFLCKEQEGFYGNIKNPDRSNHRMIELNLNDTNWFFQYSPYSYFPEHSIVLSENHVDMKINKQTFKNLVSFVKQFPHYMIGSNADLPIVGGSMLTHDHYQTGNYEFPLFKAETNVEYENESIQINSIKWPLHTIKLVSKNEDVLIENAQKVLTKWQNYSDIENNVINESNEVKHNTITPIVRYKNDTYEMYLILRNNYTNEENPMGLYHVATERHHIKQENIGLIEAMGLAVLPARLKSELDAIAKCDVLPPELNKHNVLFSEMESSKIVNKIDFLQTKVGEIFVECLRDCGVFKFNEEKYKKFIRSLDEG